MVARVVVGIPTVLCLWISEIIASLPGRCAVTVLELLTGTMLTGYGSISQAILAVPCRRHWTSYYWMVRKGQFDWKAMVHALCRIVRREFPSERCVVVGDDTLIPRVSEAAPGAAIQYDHARKPNRPDYILAQTVVSLSAVDREFLWACGHDRTGSRRPAPLGHARSEGIVADHDATLGREFPPHDAAQGMDHRLAVELPLAHHPMGATLINHQKSPG